MKKLVMLILVLLLAFLPVFSVSADEETKTVDGRTERWEQESSNLNTLATMTWDQNADTLNFKGTGYADRAGVKFGFRSNITFSNTEWSVKIQFPDEFSTVYSSENGQNMHFAIAFVNTWKAWWNTSDNATKAAAFIVRPRDNDTVTVELAGRWAANNEGYGGILPVEDDEAKEYTLGETRTLEFGLKKGEDGVISALVNGEEHGKLSKVLKDDKTMSDYISEFNEGKGYLQFGATLENDTEGLALEYTITAFGGALDAFKEIETPSVNEDTPPPISQEGSKVTSGRLGSNFNWNYVILYGIGGACGIGALVCFIIYKTKKD